MAAVLLPMASTTQIDWHGLDRHIERTWRCGLIPAVNMDTGYANLIDPATRREVLRRTKSLADGRAFVAGVFVGDKRGDSFQLGLYQRGLDEVVHHGGTPILFQSFGLTSLPDDELLDAYRTLGTQCDKFLAFELGSMFVPFGKIYSLEVYWSEAFVARSSTRMGSVASARSGAA
jgi:hypothetical protein